MVLIDPNKRIDSFFEIERMIIDHGKSSIEFSEYEINIYQNFANSISQLFSKIENLAEYQKDISLIISNLENCYNNSMLEIVVQNPVAIARAFVNGQFYFNKTTTIYVVILRAFLQLLKASSPDKARVVVNNLWQRLDTVNRYAKPLFSDELPF